MCYCGQAIVAVGSSLSEEEALSSYVRGLESKGWQAQNQLGRSRELVRGEHEGIAVRLGAPSWMLEPREDFKGGRDSFRSLVNVDVTHYLPSRAACMGEQGSFSRAPHVMSRQCGMNGVPVRQSVCIAGPGKRHEQRRRPDYAHDELRWEEPWNELTPSGCPDGVSASGCTGRGLLPSLHGLDDRVRHLLRAYGRRIIAVCF